MYRRIVLLAASAILTMSSVVPLAHAIDLSVTSQRISTAGKAPPPLGLQLFCLQAPRLCAGTAAEVRLDSAVERLLQSVNSSVNSSIQPRRRSSEIWELGARSGDCKDYAMNKRAELIARGLPAGALRLAVGLTSRGEGHAVLVVRTNKGDYVLDNLTNEIKPVGRTGHRLLSISSPDLRRWQHVS